MEEKNNRKASIKAWRVNSGMTMQDVADRLGVTRQTVIAWERDGAENKGLIIYALAKLYDIEVDDIRV